MKQPVSQPQFSIRLFDPEADIPGLVALRAEIEAVDRVGTNTSEAAVLAQMKWLGHDPAKDRWVAELFGTPDRFIGHAWIFSQSSKRSILSVGVHPDWRRRGIGNGLLGQALTRAKEHGAIQVVSGAEANNTLGKSFLTSHGFMPVGHNRFFSAPGNTVLPEPAWPSGYCVRRFSEINNLSILVKTCNRCYKDMWGHRENTEPTTEEYYVDLMKKYPLLYPPDGIFIVFTPDQTAAGICFCSVEEQNKTIDSPAVLPEYRSLDLQRPLLLAAMQWLDEKSTGKIELTTWGDYERAVQIYTELGFSLNENDHLVEYLWQGKL